MAEYHTVILGKSISYQGYFDFAKLWQHTREFMENRGYVYVEKQHNELVKEDGKQLFIHVDVARELSDYVKGRIQIQCTCADLKDVTITQDGRKKLLNDGKVRIQFEAYVITDYEGRFEDKTILFFLRTILEKFVYTRQITKFKGLVQEDLDALIKEVKAYLNLFTH